eukprot:14478117-Alexandrium_andersonii.AAC.1
MNTGCKSRANLQVVQQVLLADSLRSDESLRSVLEQCAYALLPAPIAQDTVQQLRDRRVLSKASLSRSRFLVDCAFM